MKLSSITTDAAAASSGRWFDYEDARLLIAAHLNPAHKQALQKLGKKHRHELQKNDPVLAEKVTVSAMAEAVLLDWQNITTDDGQPFSATPENRLKLLQQSAAIREFVASSSADHRNFLLEEETAATAEIKSETPLGSPVE